LLVFALGFGQTALSARLKAQREVGKPVADASNPQHALVLDVALGA
jgi:hypothetical protein